MLYKQFLTGRVFEGSNDNLTLEVENEFRDFAAKRLNALLGFAEVKSESQFTDVEVKVLKILAQNTLGNAKVRTAVTKQEQPASVAAAPRPVARVQPPPKAPVRAQQRPQLRPRQLPEDVRPQQFSHRQPPQRQQPQRRNPPPQPQQRRPPQQPPRPQPRPANQAAVLQPNQLPADQTRVEIDGKTYLVHWKQMSPSEFGPEVEQKLERVPPGRNIRLPNGIRVAHTAGGEYYKVLFRDLSKQKTSPTRAPMPSMDQMATISAMRASEALTALPKEAHKLAGIITG
jgi:hypothetical protein